jgi:hypothetical protein
MYSKQIRKITFAGKKNVDKAILTNKCRKSNSNDKTK